MDLISSSTGYQDLLSLRKSRIRTVQVRAALAVNQELVLLYGGIGNEILPVNAPRVGERKSSWFHNCVLPDKVKAPVERAWYIEQAIQNGWSRNVLVMQIESGLYRRQGKALTNFQATSYYRGIRPARCLEAARHFRIPTS